MHFSVYYYSTVFAVSTYAYTPAPVALRPGSWLGIDGNWSTVSFQLGSNSQAVDVLVSTTLSEFWAVGSGGCHDKMLHCSTARGGVYTPRASKTWTSLGTWQLGLEYLGYGGNGEYGQDSALITHTLGTDDTLSMSGVLIAAINTTDYLNGLFGLGITQGNFGGKVAMSPLTEAVQKAGWIPSYSYGYTAGASYRNSPVSLTLGGYQEARFVNHGISFTLGSADNLPRSLVRGIEVSVQDGPSEPEGWNSSTEILSTWDNYFEALIDSTTPYLWLPDELCDKLEAAFNLTYNNTFELYTLTNDQYREFMKEDSISFTFSLSSFDNTDDFGQPLDAYGVVNITIPARAFTGTLQYPFMNAAIAYGDPAVPFFALRRASNTSTMIIGRSFLQESYIITKYDEAVFSIHQALFPNSSASDLVLTPIWQPGNNVYPGPPSRGGSGLSTAEKAGIAVGVIVGCLVAGIIGWLFYRRQRNKKNAGSETRSKGGESSDSPTVRGSLVSRIFSLLGRRKKSPKEGAVLEKVAEQPCEAPNTQIYELPAPIPPAELDGDDASSLNGDTLGAESTQSMSAYEVARRKMDRQLQGPAPAYTPPSDGGLIPAEKTDHVTTTLAIPPRLRTHPPSPPSSLSATDSGTANTNSLRPSLPSPITPRLDWTNRMGEPPSPLTSTNVGSSTHLSGPSLRPMSARSEAGSMTSSHISPTTDRFVEPSNLPLSVPMGQATVQRTPIEPSRVVLLGPLPDNVRLSRRNSGSRHADADVEAGPPDVEVHRGHRTYDSLGSNFTVDEELRLDLTRQMDQSSAQSTNQQSNTRLSQVQTQGLGTQRSSPNNGTEPSSPDSQGRINPGLDLVHVPQLAERRYSWEEER